MSKRKPRVGIIAEDRSDIECVRALIFRITNDNKIGVDGMAKNGCTMLVRKCGHWAVNLHEKGCNLLIVIHDSDGKDPRAIHNRIELALHACPIVKKIITIPVEEIEAWLLADPNAIKKGINLDKIPKINRNVEQISSPKEFLEDIIDKTSNREKIYINSKHNAMIARNIDIEKIKEKCPSFLPFLKFVQENTVS
ncbi:MAG: DUF4276 family protein [Candidatus Moranbacteria bacterium]|nr:DUF4276 family protein [Candidatus Moranbacteria bacterium]